VRLAFCFVPKADIAFLIRTPRRRVPLLGFDAGSLNNWPPLRDFGFLQRAERLGGLFLAPNNHRADLFDPRAQGWIGQAFHNSGIDSQTPVQTDVWNVGNPASFTVGMSSAAGIRVLEVTA